MATAIEAHESILDKARSLQAERARIRKQQAALHESGELLDPETRARLTLLDTELSELSEAEPRLRQKANALREQQAREMAVTQFTAAAEVLQSCCAQLEASAAQFADEASRLLDEMRAALSVQQAHHALFQVRSAGPEAEIGMVIADLFVDLARKWGADAEKLGLGPIGDLNRYPSGLAEAVSRSYAISPRPPVG